MKWRGAWGGHSCGEGGVSRGASGGTSRGWMLLTAPSRWLAVAVVVVPLATSSGTCATSRRRRPAVGAAPRRGGQTVYMYMYVCAAEITPASSSLVLSTEDKIHDPPTVCARARAHAHPRRRPGGAIPGTARRRTTRSGHSHEGQRRVGRSDDAVARHRTHLHGTARGSAAVGGRCQSGAMYAACGAQRRCQCGPC